MWQRQVAGAHFLGKREGKRLWAWRGVDQQCSHARDACAPRGRQCVGLRLWPSGRTVTGYVGAAIGEQHDGWRAAATQDAVGEQYRGVDGRRERRAAAAGR